MNLYSLEVFFESTELSGGARSRNLGGHLRGNTHFWGGKIEFHEIFPPPRCQNF